MSVVDRIAAIPDVGVRREAAIRAAADRRANLEKYATAYAERYGLDRAPASVWTGDAVLLELELLSA